MKDILEFEGQIIDFCHFVDERDQVIKFYPTIQIKFKTIEAMTDELPGNLFTKLNDLYLNHRKIQVSISDLSEKGDLESSDKMEEGKRE